MKNSHEYEQPSQKFFVGDLVQITEKAWPYFEGGEIGLVTLARCDEVCVKGGSTLLGPEEGGPQYTLEWCYVALFDAETAPQGRRLDRLSPAVVVSRKNES